MITYADLFDAIEKNGLPKYKEDYFQNYVKYTQTPTKEIVGAACALGQGYLNILEEHPDVPYRAYEFYDMDTIESYPIFDQIAHWNDDTNMTLSEIAEMARITFHDVLRDPLPFKWNVGAK